MLTALATASRVLPTSVSSKTRFNPLEARSSEQPTPEGFVTGPQGAVDVAGKRGFAHPFFAHSRHPDVIAHRGGDGEWPGETMMAMKGASDLKVDVLEMDVYLTKDGHLVLMHDLYVGKTTEVHCRIKWNCPVHKYTLAELQELNAGYHWQGKPPEDCKFFGKKFNELQEDCKGKVRVPTLREVFEAFPQMRMNIEMKPASVSPAKALSQLIREMNMRDNVLVASFWHPYLKEFRSLYPEVATSASAKELIRYILKGKTPKADAVQLTPQLTVELKKKKIIQWSILTEEFVARAHKDNLPVHAWTINDRPQMERISALGVDGIITDDPRLLLTALKRPVSA